MTNKERKQIEDLIKRYKNFIGNINYNINQVDPNNDYHKRGKVQKEIYTEVIKGLQDLLTTANPTNSKLLTTIKTTK